MPERRLDEQIESELDPPVPHFNPRPAGGTPAEQGGLRMQVLEVAADRNRFGNHAAIVENEDRHTLIRIEAREVGLAQRVEIAMLTLDLDRFFGKKDAHAAGVRRGSRLDDLHEMSQCLPDHGCRPSFHATQQALVLTDSNRTKPMSSTLLTVATFYRFVEIAEPAALCADLRIAAERHGITGTILIAAEGINATIVGTGTGIASLVSTIMSDPRFGGLDVKYSTARVPPFGRLKVKLKREIVTFGAPEANPAYRTGNKVKAADWNELIARPGVVLIDTRNTYEVAIGTFPGSIDPGTTSFQEFKAFVSDNLDPARDRTIAMFCTGGIRCEKASAYLLEQGFAEVHQLDGGILKYLEEIPPTDSVWQGECYVFDGRVALKQGLAEGSHVMCRACGSPVAKSNSCDCGRHLGFSQARSSPAPE